MDEGFDPLIPAVGRACRVRSSQWDGDRAGRVLSVQGDGPSAPCAVEVQLEPDRDRALIEREGTSVLMLRNMVVDHPGIRRTMPADRPWAAAAWPAEDFAEPAGAVA